MKKVILRIDGMSCSACQNRVEKYLNRQDGVSASVNLVMAQAVIEYDDSKITLKDLNRFVKESGYKSLGVYNKRHDERYDNTKYYLIIYAFLIIIFMYISMGHMLGLPVISFLNMIKYPINYGVTLFLFTIPFIIFGFDIIRSGVVKLFHRSPNMDSLVSVGVIASFLYSVYNLVLIILGDSLMVEHLYFEGCAMILYFIKLGRFIDSNSKEKTKEAIKELVQITPSMALIKRDGEGVEITIDEVNVGDILICKPGMKVAVDGVIVSGDGHLDEAFITGEAIPNKKKINDKVIAGSINIDGYFEYKALKIGPESTISEIVRLVMEATSTKTKLQRLADIVSGYFVPTIFIISIVTFITYLILGKPLFDAVISFVTVLVVACPCALGLATPLAMVVSSGRCAKDGLLVKSNEILENAYKIDTIIFDKTGTLTYGNLKVSKIFNYSKYSDSKLLEIVSSLEKNSTHPIALAFNSYYNSKVKVTNFKNITGVGLSGVINGKRILIGNSKVFDKCRIENSHIGDEEELTINGNSIIYVIEDNNIIGLIGVKDIIRDNSSLVVSKLKDMGINIILLSGDNFNTASIISKEIGIDNVISDVLPKDKEKVIKDLISDGHNVMMVGDGINDALALASSSIGVSINSGTDIAADSSDVILLHDDLSMIINLLNISSRTVKIIKENLFWAFIYNILMIPIAVGLLKPFGISISPMFASLSMTISSLCVVFNSLRLKK